MTDAMSGGELLAILISGMVGLGYTIHYYLKARIERDLRNRAWRQRQREHRFALKLRHLDAQQAAHQTNTEQLSQMSLVYNALLTYRINPELAKRFLDRLDLKPRQARRTPLDVTVDPILGGVELLENHNRQFAKEQAIKSEVVK